MSIDVLFSPCKIIFFYSGHQMKYDVIVIGGGPAGLSLASALGGTNLSILVIDKQTQSQLAEPEYDGREIALTHTSKKIMKSLGMWSLIPQKNVSLIKEAKVFNGGIKRSLHFSHLDTDKAQLGFMVSNHQIKKAAYELSKQHANVDIMTDQTVKSLVTNKQHAWVELSDGLCITADFVVSADSRFSETRRQMGIATSMLDFGRTCFVSTMKIEKSHHDTASEYFFYDRTVALLPLNNQQVSVVITLKSEFVAELLDMGISDLARSLEQQLGYQFGAMSFNSKLYQYPLVATLAKQFYSNRYAVIGDAAVGMHPVTAHGFNLGLKGAYTLANEIKSALQLHQCWYGTDILRNYGSKHMKLCRPLYHGTNAIVTLFNQNHTAAKIGRDLLLRASDKIKPLKRLITDQLTEAKY